MPKNQKYLKDILVNIKYSGDPKDCCIQNITHDSRKVRPGTLFVAIKGRRSDGHDFILDAIQSGASAIMSNGRSLSGLPVPVIQVENPRRSLSAIAANFYDHPSDEMNIIGITGTNGKTSTTMLINSVLKSAGIASGTLGTLGFSTPSGLVSTGFTTPESVDIQQLLRTLRNGGIDHVIMEISSHALELHRVDDVRVKIAVFTNLTPEHLDFHGDMESYYRAKASLFNSDRYRPAAVVNISNEYGRRLVQELNGQAVTYSFGDPADVFPIESKMTLSGSSAVISAMGRKINIRSDLIGRFNLENILAAVSVCTWLDVPPAQIQDGIRQVRTVPGRMEVLKTANSCLAVVDYAHTPDAYRKVMTLVKELSPPETGIYTVFGAGGNRDRTKRPEMARIAEQYSRRVYVTTDNPRHESQDQICRDILAGFSSLCYDVIPDRSVAIRTAVRQADPGSVVLILGKGRDDYQQIGSEKQFHSDIQTVEQLKQ